MGGLNRLWRRVEAMERAISANGTCQKCGGEHVKTLVELMKRANTGERPPACSCRGCCPDWAGLAREARIRK